MDASPFFTVGHSTRTVEEFIRLLRAGDVGTVADIRRLPGSRTHPQFQRDALAETLAEAGIRYTHVPELGGRRARQPHVPDDLNAFWRNRSFHNYADYALGEEFRSGLRRLLALGADRPPAVMCSEAVWWRCHRRTVADHLLAGGAEVFHLMGEGRAEPARMTEAARRSEEGMLVYPASGG